MSIPIYGDANDTELVTTKSMLSLRAASSKKWLHHFFDIKVRSATLFENR